MTTIEQITTRQKLERFIKAALAYRNGWSSNGCPDPSCNLCQRNTALAAEFDAAYKELTT